MSTIDSLLLKSANLDNRKYRKGERILEQGRNSQSLKILADGSVDVSVDGQSVCMIMTKGAVFGEVAALLGSPATATVTALETCYVHYAPSLPALFRSQPEASWELARFLANRLIGTNELLVTMKKKFQEIAPGLESLVEYGAALKQLKVKWDEAETQYAAKQSHQVLEESGMGSMDFVTYERGQVLMQEGVKSGKMCILREGLLEITSKGVKVGEIKNGGALVGEISALLDIPHSATVTARYSSKILIVDHTKDFFKSHPDASLAVARLLARRLAVTNEYFVQLKKNFEELNTMLGKVAKKYEDRKDTQTLSMQAQSAVSEAEKHVNMAVFGGMLHPIG